jgi:hypothetical protein
MEDSDNTQSDDREPPKGFMKQVGWICNKLREAAAVSREQFLKHFLEGSPGKPDTLKADWCRAKNAVKAVFQSLGMNVDEENANLLLTVPIGLPQFATEHFQSDQDFEAKQHIGSLVADFLLDQGLSRLMSVFLGSGSTVFHVGYKMCERGKYRQLFFTVNIPLAALWCQQKNPPVKKVSIPEAELETDRSRLATIQKPRWTPAIAIVGADGCHFDPVKKEVFFYAMDIAVAINTNLFVKNATDLVVVCMASRKIGFGTNMGPLLDLPQNRGVRRALVTDKPPDKIIAEAITAAGWTIITKPRDWERLPKPLSPSDLIRISKAKSKAGSNVVTFPIGEEEDDEE